MAAPLGGVGAILREYLVYALRGEELWNYEPPEKCHERACSKFGRAVFWAAKYVEDSEIEILLAIPIPSIPRAKHKRFYPLSTDKEEAAFRRAAERLRDKKTGEFAGINEGDLKRFWYEAHVYEENQGRPTAEGAVRDATRLALVYALLRHSGITVKEACGAVALGEDLFKQLPDRGMDPSSRLPHTARELLACTKDLRAVRGLAGAAVKEADKLRSVSGHNIVNKFEIACVGLGRTAKRLRLPGKELRNARTIKALWDKHRLAVEDIVGDMRIPVKSITHSGLKPITSRSEATRGGDDAVQ